MATYLGRGVHLGQNLLGESLLNLVDVDGAAGFSDTFGLSLGQLLDVAVHRVLHQSTLLVHSAQCERSELKLFENEIAGRQDGRRDVQRRLRSWVPS